MECNRLKWSMEKEEGAEEEENMQEWQKLSDKEKKWKNQNCVG